MGRDLRVLLMVLAWGTEHEWIVRYLSKNYSPRASPASMYHLAFIEQIFISVHEFRLVHSASFERAMINLTGLRLIDISDELVVLGLRFLVPLV